MTPVFFLVLLARGKAILHLFRSSCPTTLTATVLLKLWQWNTVFRCKTEKLLSLHLLLSLQCLTSEKPFWMKIENSGPSDSKHYFAGCISRNSAGSGNKLESSTQFTKFSLSCRWEKKTPNYKKRKNTCPSEHCLSQGPSLHNSLQNAHIPQFLSLPFPHFSGLVKGSSCSV